MGCFAATVGGIYDRETIMLNNRGPIAPDNTSRTTEQADSKAGTGLTFSLPPILGETQT